MTRGHLTMTWVVSFSTLREYVPRRSHGTRVNSSKEQTWTSPFLDPEKCGRDLVAAVALKFADLGHACKKRILHEEWTARITNEFWTLGEREQDLGVAVSPLCDRQTDVDVAKSQVGFFSFICMPFYTVVACVEIKILRRVRVESSRRPPRHRRDACSIAWRCRFLAARLSQGTQRTG